MTELAPIRLEDGTIIYIEASENVKAAPVKVEKPVDEEEEKEIDDKGLTRGDIQKQIAQFQAIESTIRAYTTYSLKAFKSMSTENIKKVTLEFGIKIGAEASIPYITKGTAESNLKITVECELAKKDTKITP